MLDRVIITDDNTATFVCPKCKKWKTKDVSRYKNTETSVRVKIKCPCGHAYAVILERRKCIRKNVNLPGKFISYKKSEADNIIVTDISQTGLRFKLEFPQDFAPEEKLNLEFTLDDKQRSLVKKKVIVRTVKDLSIGVEFLSAGHYDKLGPYLFRYMK
jgi:hypothetical protein